MKLSRENFLIQVKYVDLAQDPKNVEKYFLGYGGELYLNADEVSNYDSEIINSIKTFADKNSLPLRLHAPIAEIDYSEITNTISYMHSLYEKVIQFCKILNINHVVTHAEFRYDNDFPVDKQFNNGISLWSTLYNNLGMRKIYLNIENHFEAGPDYLIKLMEKIGSPYLGMCIDIGHSNAFSNLSIQKWLARYHIGSIKEVHLADNEGDGDTHLPLGEGNIDFESIFNMLNKRNEKHIFVLEPRDINEAEKSISFLKKLGIFSI